MAIGYKNWIKSRVAFLREYFLMNEWSVDIIWETKGNSEHEEGIASINTDHRYLQASITVYPRAEELWTQGRLDKLSEMLVHEFSHVLTEPLFEIAWRSGTRGEANTFLTDIREQQTQRTALVIKRGLPARFHVDGPIVKPVPKKKKAKK